jgi:YesN/AraC family two-component response regulator
MLVDDDPFVLAGIGKGLSSEGYGVTTVDRGEDAIELLTATRFDLVITDLVMEGTDGIQILKKTKELYPDTIVMILTGYGELNYAVDALRNKADDYLLKPCDPEVLCSQVAQWMDQVEIGEKRRKCQRILPVCCVCHSVRDDSGEGPAFGRWMTAEEYLHRKEGFGITSTYCPACAQKVMEEMDHS